ncbi:MAG TPA: DUF2892 domain-containing protein [Methanothrix sp.]|nr:DUF2892 domain-containing protein [Methanothrix sp.]HQJ79037.1 DUF2892 domain-containing protein [Methanothrix sp.]
MKNLGSLDRMIRLIVAEVCLIAALFWAGEELQLPLILAAAVILIPAITGSCGLYELLGWNSCEMIKRKNDRLKRALVLAAILLAVMGSFASHLYTKDILLQDLGEVNETYNIARQSLIGDDANSPADIDSLERKFAAFAAKYSKYKPLVVRIDGNFSSQIDEISADIYRSKQSALQGDAASSRMELEPAGEIIRAMIKENR